MHSPGPASFWIQELLGVIMNPPELPKVGDHSQELPGTGLHDPNCWIWQPGSGPRRPPCSSLAVKLFLLSAV